MDIFIKVDDILGKYSEYMETTKSNALVSEKKLFLELYYPFYS
jgi:hypothetical protein